MFCATVVGRRVGCWGTWAMRVRRVGVCRVERGRWFIVRGWGLVVVVGDDDEEEVEEGGYRARRREAMVDLPLPEAPTRAVVVRGWRVRDREVRTWAVGRVG